MPEKAQKQYNFCLIPTTALDEKIPKGGFAGEPVLWTVNDGAPLSVLFHDRGIQSAVGGSDQVLESALEYAMRSIKKKVTCPDDAEFVSATPESHRKGEKAYHVKAFKGSKDGKHDNTLLSSRALTPRQATSFSFPMGSSSASKSLSSSSA